MVLQKSGHYNKDLRRLAPYFFFFIVEVGFSFFFFYSWGAFLPCFLGRIVMTASDDDQDFFFLSLYSLKWIFTLSSTPPPSCFPPVRDSPHYFHSVLWG